MGEILVLVLVATVLAVTFGAVILIRRRRHLAPPPDPRRRAPEPDRPGGPPA